MTSYERPRAGGSHKSAALLYNWGTSFFIIYPFFGFKIFRNRPALRAFIKSGFATYFVLCLKFFHFNITFNTFHKGVSFRQLFPLVCSCRCLRIHYSGSEDLRIYGSWYTFGYIFIDFSTPFTTLCIFYYNFL